MQGLKTLLALQGEDENLHDWYTCSCSSKGRDFTSTTNRNSYNAQTSLPFWTKFSVLPNLFPLAPHGITRSVQLVGEKRQIQKGWRMRTCRSSERSSSTIPPHPAPASAAQRAMPGLPLPLRRRMSRGCSGGSLGVGSEKRSRRRAAHASIARQTTAGAGERAVAPCRDRNGMDNVLLPLTFARFFSSQLNVGPIAWTKWIWA